MKHTRITREQLVEMLNELGEEAGKTPGLEDCAPAIAFAANAISENLSPELDMPTMVTFIGVLVRKGARKFVAGLKGSPAAADARERAARARLN